jgi:hypothetical protein
MHFSHVIASAIVAAGMFAHAHPASSSTVEMPYVPTMDPNVDVAFNETERK